MAIIIILYFIVNHILTKIIGKNVNKGSGELLATISRILDNSVKSSGFVRNNCAPKPYAISISFFAEDVEYMIIGMR